MGVVGAASLALAGVETNSSVITDALQVTANRPRLTLVVLAAVVHTHLWNRHTIAHVRNGVAMVVLQIMFK